AATGLDRSGLLAWGADGEIFEGPSLLVAAEMTGGEGEAEAVVRFWATGDTGRGLAEELGPVGAEASR
ncbi:MAG TPA: hypothetical protein VIT65_03120, partial [Microlunatus sp.]